MSQLHAAYLLDSVKELFDKSYFFEKLYPIIQQLSYFEADNKSTLTPKDIHPQTAVVHNMITAGRPIRPSEYIEELFAEHLKRTKKVLEADRLCFPFEENDLKNELEAAFYITDPRRALELPSGKSEKAQFNKQVIDRFTTATHKAFAAFFFRNNRPFSSIIPENDHSLTKDEAELVKHTPEYIIELPSAHRGTKGLIIETDPETGMAGMDFLAVEKKKAIAARYGYQYIYAKNGQLPEAVAAFESFTFNDYFDRIRKNYDVPLYGRNTGKDAMQYVLSPIAVARIQKTITEYIFAGKLNPDSKKWTVGVIERDVPAAFAAFEDLRRRYNKVCAFQGVSKSFPEVDLDIYAEADFTDSKLHRAGGYKTLSLDEFDSKKDYDLLIDISVLQTKEYGSPTPRNAAAEAVKIRSSFTRESTHHFYFGKNLNFFSRDPKTESKRKEAFTQVLRDVFRTPDFPEIEMNRLIRSILGDEYVLLYSPLKYSPEAEMLFALFRPGVTVSVLPNDISLLNRFYSVRAKDLHGAFYLNGIQHRIKDKKAVAKRVARREALLLYTTADFVRNPFWLETIEAVKAEGINFSGVFVNGVTAVSEFSADFNPFYKGMVTRLRNILKVKGFGLPVLALGHHCEYAVKEDIKADTGIHEMIEDKPLIPGFDIQLIETKITGISDPETILKKTRSAKQKVLLNLLDELYENEKVLVIYPFKSGKNGYYSQNAEDDFSDLSNHFSKGEMVLFSENGFWERTRFDAADYVSSKKAYERFNENRAQIMLATEQIIEALPPKGLRKIVLYNMPSEPETMYKIVTLFWSDSPENMLYILNDESEFINREIIDAATADGKQESMEQVAGTASDRYVRGQKARLHFFGRKSDFAVADELLKQISFPERDAKTELEQALWREFELETELYAMPEDEPVRIFAGKDNKNIGSFDFITDLPNSDYSVYNETFSNQVLFFIREWVYKQEEKPNDYLKHFTRKISGTQVPGIEKRFEGLKNGNSTKVKFYLRNNHIAVISDLILKHTGFSFDREQLRFLLETSVSEKEFVKRMSKAVDLNVVNRSIDLPTALKNAYLSYRDVCKTLLAVSRFYDMGLVDDYTADLNSGRIELHITKRTDAFYKGKLKVILSKYLSSEKAEEIYNNLDDYSGDTVIRKVLNFLINFLYDELREQRYYRIDAVSVWLNNLRKHDDNEIRKAELKNYFYTVFSAKYLNSLAEHSIVNETDDFEGGSFDTVMNFIYKAEYLKNNIEHLYLSSEKAQKVYPDNYIVLLLNAFARFRKFGSQEGFDKAFARLYAGFEAMEQNERLDYEEAVRRRKLFLDILYEYNRSLQEETDPLIYLKTHTQKLHEFNVRFLEGFPVK